MADKNIGKMLVDEGLINEDQLAVALETQKNLGGELEHILIRKSLITEEQFLKVMAKAMNVVFVNLSRYKVDPNAVKLLPMSLARKYKAIPIFSVENKVTVATSNPNDVQLLDDLRSVLHAEVQLVLASGPEIDNAINTFYKGSDLTEEASSVGVEILGSDDESIDVTQEELEEAVSGVKIVNAVNGIIASAFQQRASDIHIEPERNSVKVRARVDGVLQEITTFQKTMHLPVISRIKVIGGMDLAERRVPQDGRVRVRVEGKELDLRIATYPTMFGEAAAIRLLTKEQLITLEDLGFLEKDLDVFRQLIKLSHGIFLVTGPTGSGKTTTLYSALMQINTKENHVLSIEDPVEHEIPGVDQQQVNVKAGLTFASSLRAMLREDPDIIMVGEIRDAETAEIAVRAAMTGHFVFSTLHTNTSLGAISRLADLGVETYLVASTIVGVMAQRLVRRICPKCKEEVDVSEVQRAHLGIDSDIQKAFKGRGCNFCKNTGYRGRIGLFDIVPIDDEMRVLINKQLPEIRLRERAISAGFHTMLDDGVEKIKRGLTTVEEVIRVTADAI